LVVVAEGVETLEQLHFLRDRQCDIIQGFLISQPLPEAELRRFMANGKWLDQFALEKSSQQSAHSQAALELVHIGRG
jgi:predicted signal transduction protein with EAL and GGDEF domain